MTLTENDIRFLQAVNIIGARNKEAENVSSIVTTRQLLSDDLLKIFEVKPNAEGFWCFNVYVEFEPMFKEKIAKEWQK